MERTAGWRSSIERKPAKPAPSPAAPRRIAVGRVRDAHGLRGQLRVQVFGGSPETLLGLARVTIGHREDDPQASDYDVESASPGREGEVRMRLAGLRRREDAEALRGRLVMVDASAFAALPADEYWGFQLVETGDGRAVGAVREIWNTGAHDVLVVVDAEGRERLIPAVRELLPEVDVEQRRIVVDAIPGLLDDFADGPEDHR
jgi:16S rRNA processing protein RimM